jgi:hypothetical protein
MDTGFTIERYRYDGREWFHRHPTGTVAMRVFRMSFATMARPACILVFVLTPVTVVSLLLAVHSATLLNCCPIFNDEIHYWNEIDCFAAAGFNGGYFVPDEHAAPARRLHFGPHGPGFPVVYGSLAKLLGWYPASGPVFHLIVLALASAFWLWSCRPDTDRLLTGIFLLATFWPCILYLPSTMQEGLHCAIAFLLAALAHRSVNTSTPAGRTACFFLPAVAAASIVRLTWVLVLIPWACVALGHARRRTRWLILGVVACGIPALVVFNRWSCAPYPNFASKLVETARSSPERAFEGLVARGRHALAMYFALNAGDSLLVVQRYLVAALILVCLIRSVCPGTRGGRPYFFVAMNLALVTGLMIALYDLADGRDCRVVAPHLLMSVLVLLSGSAFRWVLGVAAIHLVFVSPFLQVFASIHEERFSCQASEMTKNQENLLPYLPYDAHASPWGNTLLVSLNGEDSPPVTVPSGIGISYVVDESTIELPLKSRYILPWRARAQPSVLARARLRRLSSTPLGVIYENLDFDAGSASKAASQSPKPAGSGG